MKTIPLEIFEEIYKNQYRKLRTYAYRILKDDQLAEDAAHESLFRLHNQDFEKIQGHVESWLYTVCRNHSLKQLKKNSRFVEIFEEDRDEMDESRDPSEEFDMNTYKKVLKRYMKKLTKRQRDIIKLRFFKGFDYNECAQKLKTTSGNIGFHQTTAIQSLRRMMSKYING
jgi:RNA polymerase sigma-70 factor (ECF subfamily)